MTKSVLMAMMATFCVSIAKAQYSNALAGATLIYSNGFDGSATANITNTPADQEYAIYGGVTGSNWVDLRGPTDTGEFFANGTETCTLADTIVLPFTPQSNHVYAAQFKVTLSGSPGTWIAAGFDAYDTINTGHYEFNGNGGWDWYLVNANGSIQYFAGQSTGTTIYSADPLGTAAGFSHTLTYILDTTFDQNPSNCWTITAFYDGVQLGSPHTYPSNPLTPNPITGVGYGQYATISSPQYIQWNSFKLTANQELIVKQPISATNSAGTAFTNSVLVGGTPPFYYQWYTNGVPILNATNANLVINSVSAINASTNYYVVVTNTAYGAVTSSPAILGVYTTPQVLASTPISYTNPISLFGGTNFDGTNYVGSTPTFSISAVGGVPLSIQWYTNGVAVGWATNASVTFTNCQLGGPTNFAVIVTNIYGSITNAISATYLPTPTAQYPQATLALQPIAFWRLNEQPDNNNGDDGTIANDYESGNNGMYTNVVLDQEGYNPAEPGETSVFFGNGGNYDSFAGGIQGIDFAKPTGSNGEFTVDAWANCEAADAGAPVLSQGSFGSSDAFGLGVDTNSSRYFWFYVRSANGTVYRADSTVVADDNNWHHLVGVCDEANSNLSLYVDGHLVQMALIPTNSGVYEASAPMVIGSGTSVAGTYNVQFFGNIADVGAYNYALNAAQIAGVFGASPVPTFVAPLPPTSWVYMQNGTLTISATAFGAPPLGYYWTNVTVGGIVASGKTNVLANMNATLAIPNAPASLNGDELELVVTNAYGSTNWIVSLSSPALPVTVGYTNGILYSNEFNGGTWSIAGQAATAVNSLVGGTSTTWIDALGTNDTGSLAANGVDGTTLGDSWMLPFTPHSGFVYTLTGELTFSGNPGNWVGLGFAQTVPTNATAGRYTDVPNGYDWIILTESSGNVQYFAGPNTTPVQGLTNAVLFTSGTGSHTVQVVLDTTGPQWVQYAFVDGVPAGTNTYATNPPISGFGMTQNSMSSPAYIQWNYVALTQVSPNGFAPYLLPPVPSVTSIVLTNTTVTIPATGFGTGPWGYYWSNNSTVITSGATNNTAPDIASISVPSSSLSAGQLELALTNAYGTNITLVTLVSPIPTSSPKMGITVSNGVVYVSWPGDHTGWQLQAQTNSVSVGISTNWVNVAGSTATNEEAFPPNPNDAVFYRLLYNP